MDTAIGIRREDKNLWERRVPLVPSQVARLMEEHRLTVYVQPSNQRIFPDEAYRKAGAKVQEDLSSCQAILGVKEMPLAFFERGKTYLFFSHTIKGQPYNMPMLRRMMELECQLIDYERIIDEKNRRLVLFGRHAGLAGMIETLRALGERLSLEGVPDSQNSFSKIKPAYRYENLMEAKTHMRAISREIEEKGLPRSIVPMVIGFLGYGNVSQGAQEILDCFKVEEIRPEDLFSRDQQPRFNRIIYKVIFQEKDTVEPLDGSTPFSLSDYFDHPDRYRATFSRYLPFLTVVVNGIYWEKNFPVLIQAEDVRKLYGESRRPTLRVIGDITCDIEGSIAVTRKSTLPDRPCYVYDTVRDRIEDGINDLNGPVLMAVDNLPTEFPVESSNDFGNALFPFIPPVAHTDFVLGLDKSPLPDAIKRAVILVQGRFTESYRYLEKFVSKMNS